MANLQMMQQQADLYNEQMGKYGQEASKFNMAADVYNRQVKEYQAMVDAYKALPGYQAYEKAVAAYNPQAEAYNKKADAWNNKTISVPLGYGYGNKVGTPSQLYAEYQNMVPAWRNGGYGQNLLAGIQPYFVGSLPTQPVNTVADKAPGEFTATKPELTAKAPKDPGFTGQQMKQLQGQQTLAQQEKAGENETGLINRVQGQKQKPDSLIGGMLQNVRYST